MSSNYEAVIGLEVHAQLSTGTKIFCGCSTNFGNPPNTNVCPVCLGHPGVLPVLNKKVVEYSVMMGLATECKINSNSIFARKNYFYPDLPKGYQISQFEKPICEFGKINITTANGKNKDIGITRIHMEEDAGKSIHDQGDDTLVDVNRCGVPLIEIVSEPDISTPEEAYLYLSKLKQILTYLDICDGNMEEGSLRCDANISIREVGDTKLGTRTEVKNMNSFRNVERAIQFEIDRQIDLVKNNEEVVQQTMLWNADLNEAYPIRGKEESHDYRYFPDPDLMPVEVNDEWMTKLKSKLPELPTARKERFIKDFSLPEYDAEILTSSKELADYYENILAGTKNYKAASNWLMGDTLSILKGMKISIEKFPVEPNSIAELINLIDKGTISGSIAKSIFQGMIETGKSPETIVKEKNLVQITDTSEIEGIVDSVLENNAAQVQEYLGGKEKVIGFLVGQVMKESKGKANPGAVNQILKKKLEEKR